MIFGTNIVYDSGDDHKEKFVCSSFTVGQGINPVNNVLLTVSTVEWVLVL
jgi:hypothetical protein